MGLEFLVPVFGILIVLVPITGLTMVLTAKFATKPIVDALIQLRGGDYASPTELELHVRDLAEQVEELTGEIRRLKAAQSFDEKLLKDRAESTAP
jgi:hypothetical protein